VDSCPKNFIIHTVLDHIKKKQEKLNKKKYKKIKIVRENDCMTETQELRCSLLKKYHVLYSGYPMSPSSFYY
jgi:hypothetical protein